MTMIDNRLRVPGATLYYETRGSGPLLLMISGGPADADVFSGLAEALADRYTVVTYDTRGNSRSVIDSPPLDQSIQLEADDAQRLLEALTDEPAFVFGNSSGAMVGLELVSRFGRGVHTLVAHEAPLTELLPDAAEHRARAEDIYQTLQRQGVGPAMMKFMGGAGLQPPTSQAPAPEPDANAQQAMARMGNNVQFFLEHRLRLIAAYQPDVSALRASPSRTVVATGADSTGQLVDRCGMALSQLLNAEVVQFPGGHGGFSSHPREFAEQLDHVLRT